MPGFVVTAPTVSSSQKMYPLASVVRVPPFVFVEQLYAENLSPPPNVAPPANVEDADCEAMVRVFAWRPPDMYVDVPAPKSASPPLNVDVEFVPETVRNPEMVDVA